jgi:hypothetical protein
MRVIIRDYLAFHRRKISLDALIGFGAGICIAIGLLLSAMAHDRLDVALRPRGMTILALILVGSPALVCLSHLITAWLIGVTSARSAGLSLSDYVKSDAYEQGARRVLRDFYVDR